MLPAGAAPTSLPANLVDPATYSGEPTELELTAEAARRMEVTVIRLVPKGRTFLIYPFIDIAGKALSTMIHSKFLPPFWLCIKSMQPIIRRNELGISGAYRLQLSSDYLKDTESTFASFLELLENIGRESGRWTLEDRRLREKTVVLRLKNATMSLTEQLIQAMPMFKPRPLTEAEKLAILNEIPPIRSCDRYVSELHHAQTLQHVREQLNGITLSSLRLNQYKQQVRAFYLRALYQPYEKVGITATDSICAPVMQGMLNARHDFGKAKTGLTATADQVEQVLLNQVIKNKEMVLYMMNRRSTENDILLLKSTMEQVTMKIAMIGGSIATESLGDFRASSVMLAIGIARANVGLISTWSVWRSGRCSRSRFRAMTRDLGPWCSPEAGRPIR